MTYLDIFKVSIIFFLSLTCATLLFAYANLLAYVFGIILGFIMLIVAVIFGGILFIEIKRIVLRFFH
jgi:hypothetical protein